MLRIDFDNGATCSLLDNAGAHYPEQSLSTISALPLSLLTLVEWEETYWNGY